MNANQQHSGDKLSFTMAIDNLEDFLGSSGKERAVRETIKRLRGPQSELDYESADELRKVQANIERIYSFSDGGFEYIDEVPVFYLDQIRETIQHEISLVTARTDISESSEDRDYVYDLVGGGGNWTKCFALKRGMLKLGWSNT